MAFTDAYNSFPCVGGEYADNILYMDHRTKSVTEHKCITQLQNSDRNMYGTRSLASGGCEWCGPGKGATLATK
jgi:hypothetical protein